MNKKATDIVAYIGLIGWLIAYFAGAKEESKVHLNQGLVLAICEIIIGILSGVFQVLVPVLSIVTSIISLVLFVLWIIGIVSAVQGTDKKLPIIGGIQLLK